MIEPVKMADFFLAFLSAASVIMFGALYALLFAFSRIKNVPRLMFWAYAAYAALFASVMELAYVANLFDSPFWIFIVILMLVGYLLAPRAIWNLCVGTHDAVAHEETAVVKGTQSSALLDRQVVNTLYQPSEEKAL
ncbi:MAG: hypothetical protein ACOH1I_03140 [Gallionellaceae bacterium]|jgi:hypothetical protein